VLWLTHLGDCLCIRIGVVSVRVIGCWHCPEIVILDFPIDLQCVVVDISTVPLCEAPRVFTNHEVVKLQLGLVG